MDTILFSLLILRGLCDSKGWMWRCHPNQLYAIESTLPKRDGNYPESRTMSLVDLMPSVFCVSPCDSFYDMEAHISCKNARQ